MFCFHSVETLTHIFEHVTNYCSNASFGNVFDCIVGCHEVFLLLSLMLYFFGHRCKVVLLTFLNSAAARKLIPPSTSFTASRILVNSCSPLSVFFPRFLTIMASKSATNENKFIQVLWNKTRVMVTLFHRTLFHCTP